MSADYIVAWKLRIIVRLEEWSNVKVVRDLASNPITPPQTMRGVTSTRSQALVAQRTPGAPGQPAGWSVNFAGGASTSAGGPQGVDSSGDGKTFTIGGVIPRSFRYHLNGFKEPDTMECELRFQDVPFDPLTFRSVGVELYVGCLTADDYAAGLAGATRQPSQGGQPEPLNVLPDGFTGPSGEPRSNLRFQGFVDEWEVDHDDENLSLVRFRCSDNTRLFIDQPMPPGMRLDGTKPVDQAVANMLANFPQFAGLVVQYRPASTTIPTVGAAFSDASQMPDGPQATQGGAKQTLSVWDYLVEVCNAIGHNVRVEGSTLVIQRVRAALGRDFPPRDDDPFTGRDWAGTHHPLRTFIQGYNCKKVVKKRRYARTTRNIEVRSWDPLIKATRIARFPPFVNTGSSSSKSGGTSRIVHALPGDGRQETKYTVYPVAGVTDQVTLQNIAQAYYEGLNRGELGVTIRTRDLASFGGDSTDPDVLDMLAGDHYEFLTQTWDGTSLADPIVDDVGQIEAKLLQQQADSFVSAGFDPAFVSAYLTTYADDGYQKTFVVRAVDVEGSIDDEGGITVTVDGANMVEARMDAPGVADFADQALGAQGTTAPTNQNQPAGGP